MVPRHLTLHLAVMILLKRNVQVFHVRTVLHVVKGGDGLYVTAPGLRTKEKHVKKVRLFCPILNRY